MQGFGVGFKLEGLVYLFTNFFNRNWGVVTKEISRSGEVALGHGIIPTDHCIVGSLKKSVLAVVDELRRLVPVTRAQFGRVAHGGHGGGGDVVLGNDLHGRLEILAQSVEPPAFGGIEADAQKIGLELHAIEAQLVAGFAIHGIHGKPAIPVVTPILAVFALDDEDQFLHMRRNGAQPVIILIGVNGVRRC